MKRTNRRNRTIRTPENVDRVRYHNRVPDVYTLNHTEDDDDDACKSVVDVKLFKIIGLYQLLQPSGIHVKWYRKVLLGVLWITFGLQIVQIYGLYYAQNDLRRFSSMTLLVVYGLMCLYKGLVLVNHGDRIWSTLDLALYGFVSSGQRNPAKLDRCKHMLTLLLRMFIVCSYFTLVIWIIGPYFIEGSLSITNLDGTVSNYRLTINNLWIPVADYVYNMSAIWALLYLMESFILAINVFCWTIFDCYLLTMCFVLNAQFHTIAFVYETIGHHLPLPSPSFVISDIHLMKSDEIKLHYNDELVHNIKNGQKIMTKLDDFFNIVRPVVLAQIVNGSTSVIILIYQISLMYIEGSPIISIEFLKLFSGFVSLNIELYMYCYAFNHIQTKKDTLNFGLYCSNWTEMDIKFKKKLLIAMNFNTAHKQQIKTSPQSIINLEMFSNVNVF
ncbi:Olfactory receptor, insect [Cinara cedri]|uniref:Odorant receptor n=1 Tax=Cinara cedri TaxID=506608 RepID=A0A5E4M1T2_9HEMI|nr:Olfactory receptor, insect [Cinara cedri]